MTQRRDGTTAEELRGTGLRVTAARVALLETVTYWRLCPGCSTARSS
ncbi:hypothetical protein [Streptomyces sp. NPDC019890]